MYKIVPATQDHFSHILEMAEKFYNTTPAAAKWPYNPDSCARLVERLIDFHVFLVALKNEVPVGMVCAEIGSLPMNDEVLMAIEHAWWVEPEHRGSSLAVRLLEALEEACKEECVDVLVMYKLPNSPAVAEKLYNKRGYEASESSFIKELVWQ